MPISTTPVVEIEPDEQMQMSTDVQRLSRPPGWIGPHPRDQGFADSAVEGSGFELVWGFSCQVVVLGFAESSLFGAGKPFFIPSPAIRFPERAEGVKGPKR